MFIRKSVFIILAAMFLCCCARYTTSTEKIIDSNQMPKAETEQQAFSLICDIDGFTEQGVWRTEIYKPFIVREIKGNLYPSIYYNDWRGRRPVFEVRALGKRTKIHRAMADNSGRFYLKDIPEGIYCFYISCLGCDDVIGGIIVDKEADRKNTISIYMQPDSH